MKIQFLILTTGKRELNSLKMIFITNWYQLKNYSKPESIKQLFHSSLQLLKNQHLQLYTKLNTETSCFAICGKPQFKLRDLNFQLRTIWFPYSM